jgi:hypothetical protein
LRRPTHPPPIPARSIGRTGRAGKKGTAITFLTGALARLFSMLLWVFSSGVFSVCFGWCLGGLCCRCSYAGQRPTQQNTTSHPNTKGGDTEVYYDLKRLLEESKAQVGRRDWAVLVMLL